jgi:hypothetical protein
MVNRCDFPFSIYGSLVLPYGLRRLLHQAGLTIYHLLFTIYLKGIYGKADYKKAGKADLCDRR